MYEWGVQITISIFRPAPAAFNSRNAGVGKKQYVMEGVDVFIEDDYWAASVKVVESERWDMDDRHTHPAPAVKENTVAH